MNTKQKGNIAIGAAIDYFLGRGQVVSIPINDSQDYDLVIEDDGILKKVQVKYTTSKREDRSGGNYQVPLRLIGGSSKTNRVIKKANEIEYDLLFVSTKDKEKYLIPKEEIEHITSSITLCEKYDKYKI